MKKIIKNPLFLLALGLLVIGASTIGATRAAFSYQTAAERVNFSTATISVDILEEVDDAYISIKDAKELTFSDIKADERFKPGKLYKENVKLVNNSNQETGYEEYVRVVVRKSWYKDGKDTALEPELIKLTIADGWFKNEAETTKEQEVYYLTSPLACGSEIQFLKGIRIDNEITDYVYAVPVKNEEGAVIQGCVENVYQYNDMKVYIQLQADAVQTHNAQDAIYAAWGIKVECDAEDDGNITSINGVSVQ
jgi:hypothetical protein